MVGLTQNFITSFSVDASVIHQEPVRESLNIGFIIGGLVGRGMHLISLGIYYFFIHLYFVGVNPLLMENIIHYHMSGSICSSSLIKIWFVMNAGLNLSVHWQIIVVTISLSLLDQQNKFLNFIYLFYLSIIFIFASSIKLMIHSNIDQVPKLS